MNYFWDRHEMERQGAASPTILDGFKKIAVQRWKPLLQQLGLAHSI